MTPESRPGLKADAQLLNHLVHLNGYFRQQILLCLVSEKPLRQEDKGKGTCTGTEGPKGGRRTTGLGFRAKLGFRDDWLLHRGCEKHLVQNPRLGRDLGGGLRAAGQGRGRGLPPGAWPEGAGPTHGWAWPAWARRRERGPSGLSPRFPVSPAEGAGRHAARRVARPEERGAARLAAAAAAAAAMKAVVQRVTRASVTVGGEQISAIGRGICVLLGISLEDTQKELEHMVRKILNLRVFEDESGKHWSKSVMDKQYEVLCISQFTLQCVLKGNKPDFHLAMPTEQAESFYNSFLEQLRKTYRPELIKDGKFGTYMQVHIQNDGPVTIELESPAPGAATSDPKQLSKLEKQQQRKEKTRAKGPSESSKERNTPRKEDRSASSGAEGDVSSEREP